jgi:nitrite reductase/ring-hydroxylating ferredoxin subunit
MKKTFLFLFMISILFACDKDSINNKNPYLPNYAFSMQINTNLPLYNDLKFASNYVKIYPSNGPSRGVIVFNTGAGFVAFDGGCPNHTLKDCSTLSLSGIEATCQCEEHVTDAVYNLFTGQSPGQKYPLKPYRVEVNGDDLRIYN